jgi:hypothetical protein
MNIHVTSPNPELCARYLDNARLIKMALETAQLMCTAVAGQLEAHPLLGHQDSQS